VGWLAKQAEIGLTQREKKLAGHAGKKWAGVRRGRWAAREEENRKEKRRVWASHWAKIG
jgi:hypothetical protein